MPEDFDALLAEMEPVDQPKVDYDALLNSMPAVDAVDSDWTVRGREVYQRRQDIITKKASGELPVAEANKMLLAFTDEEAELYNRYYGEFVNPTYQAQQEFMQGVSKANVAIHEQREAERPGKISKALGVWMTGGLGLLDTERAGYVPGAVWDNAVRFFSPISAAAGGALVRTNEISKNVIDNMDVAPYNPLRAVRGFARMVHGTLDFFGVKDKLENKTYSLEGVPETAPTDYVSYVRQRIRQAPEEMGLFEIIDQDKFVEMSTARQYMTMGLTLGADILIPGGEMALGELVGTYGKIAKAEALQDISKGIIHSDDAVQSMVDIGKATDFEAGLKVMENPVFPIKIPGKDIAILNETEIASALESLDRTLGKALAKTGDNADEFIKYQHEAESFINRITHNPSGLTYKLSDTELNRLTSLRDGIAGRIENAEALARGYESMLDLKKAEQTRQSVDGYQRIITDINSHIAAQARDAKSLPTAALDIAAESGLAEAIPTKSPFHLWMDEAIALKAAGQPADIVASSGKYMDSSTMKAMGNDPSHELQKLIRGEEQTVQEALALHDPVRAAIEGWPEAGTLKLGFWKYTGNVLETSKKIPGAYENVMLPLIDGGRNFKASVGRMVDKFDGLWKTVDYNQESARKVYKWLDGTIGDEVLSAQEMLIAKETRAFFDEALNVINEARKTAGKTPIAPVDNYVHRIVEEFKELKDSNPFLERHGGGTTVENAYESVMAYIAPLAYQIHLAPQVRHARQFAEPFKAMAGLREVVTKEGKKQVQRFVKITDTPQSAISIDFSARNSWLQRTYDYVDEFSDGDKIVRAVDDGQVKSAESIYNWLSSHIDHVGTGKANSMLRDVAAEFRLAGFSPDWGDAVVSALQQAVYAPFLSSPSYTIKNLSQTALTLSDVGVKYTGKGLHWYGKALMNKPLRKWMMDDLLGGSLSNLSRQVVGTPLPFKKKAIKAPLEMWRKFNSAMGTLSLAPQSEDLNKIVAGMAHFEKSIDAQMATNPILKLHIEQYGLNPLKIRDQFPTAYKKAKLDAIAGYNMTQFSFEKALTPPALRSRIMKATVPFLRYPVSKAGYVYGLHENLFAHLYAKEMGLAAEDAKALMRYYTATAAMTYVAGRFALDYRDAIGWSPEFVKDGWLSPNEEGILFDTAFRAGPGSIVEPANIALGLVYGEGVNPAIHAIATIAQRFKEGSSPSFKTQREMDKAWQNIAKMTFGIQGVRIYDTITKDVFGEAKNERWRKVAAKIDSGNKLTDNIIRKRIAAEFDEEFVSELNEKDIFAPTKSFHEMTFNLMGLKSITRSKYEKMWHIAEEELNTTERIADRAASLLYDLSRGKGNLQAKRTEFDNLMAKHSDRIDAKMIGRRVSGMLKENDGSETAAKIKYFMEKQ